MNFSAPVVVLFFVSSFALNRIITIACVAALTAAAWASTPKTQHAKHHSQQHHVMIEPGDDSRVAVSADGDTIKLAVAPEDRRGPLTEEDFREVAEELGVEVAAIKAIHAGLECGLFLTKYPGLDMVSFGPTLRDVHSPSESMNIPAVDRFWHQLCRTIEKVADLKK